MDSSEILLLIAIILLAVIVWGCGTSAFCCTRFESSLPFKSLNLIEDNIMKLESGTNMWTQDMCISIDDIRNSLSIQADELPIYRYIIDQATVIDLELGLEVPRKTGYSVPLRIMVSPAP